MFFLGEDCHIYLPFPFLNLRFKNFSPAVHWFSLFTYSDLSLMWQLAFSRSYLVILLSKYFHFFFQQIGAIQKLHFEEGTPLLVCVCVCVCACLFVCVCVWEGELNFPEGNAPLYTMFIFHFVFPFKLLWFGTFFSLFYQSLV